jgi:hypothetical protein
MHNVPSKAEFAGLLLGQHYSLQYCCLQVAPCNCRLQAAVQCRNLPMQYRNLPSTVCGLHCAKLAVTATSSQLAKVLLHMKQLVAASQ